MRSRQVFCAAIVRSISAALVLAAAFLGAATTGFCAWTAALGGPWWAAAFLLAQLPALFYFLHWALRVFRDERAADHRSTMRMNLIASSFMSLYFALFLIFR